MAKEWWESYAPADEPKEDWWSQYSVEAEKPQGRRDVTPFKVDIQQPAPVAARPAQPVASVPSEDYTDAMGSDFGSAIMAAATPKRASVLEGVTLPPQAPLIERRGAPVSEEKFKELKQKYDAATPKERAALIQTPGFESSVLQTIDKQYQAASGVGDTRREVRRSAYIAQGAAPELADQLAARDAATGADNQRLSQAKTSDFDFENRAEYKRPEGKLTLDETGGLIGARMVQPTGFDQLVGAGKAIGGKVSGTFQSAAAGAWQFLGDTAEAAGDLVGSTQLADVGAQLSRGNALQQKAAKAKLEAIGENPNAALNFIESGVAGAINNFAPYLINPSLGVTAAVAQTFADEYGTGKLAGQTMGEALPRAAMMATSEWIGERASLPAPLMRGFKELVKGVPANEVMPQFARYLVKENVAEQVTTAMNFGTDKWAPFGLTPDATLKDYLSAVGDTFYQTTAQTLVMGGAGRVAAPIARKLQDITTSPASAFASAFEGDVAGARFDPAAIDAYARRALDVQSYDDNIITPRQQAMVQQDQADLQASTSAGDAATAADNLAGSLSEMLVPGQAVTPLPNRIEPTLTPGLPAAPTAVEPTLDLSLPPADQGLPAINPATEQQFGLDKLRINPPRPQSIQGQPAASLTDEDLTGIANDDNAHSMTRRSAAIELTARQAEQAPTAQTFTPEQLGKMKLSERRALSQNFDQTDNEDGTTTFTAKPGAAATTSAAPVATPTFGLGAAEGRVSNAPVTGTGDTARVELQTRLNQTAAQYGVAVPTLAVPAKSDEAAVNVIAEALGGTGQIVAYADPNGADGFELGGKIAINTKTQKGIAATSWHESFHVAERMAQADTQAGRANTPAQQYVASIHSLFDDMSPEGKRAYSENFLHKDELDSITDPVAREKRTQELLSAPTLRSEMSADFMGNRATDRPFLADLAKADPKGFDGFVKKWIGILDNMLVRLRGVKGAARDKLESVKVDKYINDLNRAKMVARDAMVAFRNGTLQQSATTTTPPAMSQRQGEPNAQTFTTGRGENLPGAPTPDRRDLDEYGSNPPPSYGTARQGAISVVGRHYSATPRQTLSGEYYGRGLKGAERTRLDSSPDPRLRNRVYYYVDQGKGIRPEAGVGGYAHETKLDNIYDPQTRLIKPQADANAFESAVINAGFDGYIAPFGNGQSAVVLLGMKHKAVPVRAIGQPQAAALPTEAAPTTLKKGLMSKELSQIDTSNIPGARVRAGTLEIPTEQQDAANAELTRIGSTIRFAEKQKEMPGMKAESERATAVVSAKPGREFKVGNETAQIVSYPKAEDLEFVTSRLHARVRDVLTGSDAVSFLANQVDLKDTSIKKLGEIRGLWAGEREDTFAIRAAKADGSPATFEDSRKLANLLGFAFIQEGTVTVEPSHGSNTGIPSMLIGKPDGSKLTRAEIDSALSAANTAGFFGASEAVSGRGLKLMFFADDSSNKSTEEQYADFVDQVADVQKSTGLTAAGSFNTKSELDGANDYWTNATGQPLSSDSGGTGDQAATGKPSDLFRGVVDNLLGPYVSALEVEGFKFSYSEWQRVFGATNAQTQYLKAKVAELDNLNKHGVVPKLRQRVPITNLKQVGSRALITQKTTEANAVEQLAALDRVLAGSSNPVKSTESWLRMEAMAYGTNDVPMAPNRFIQMYNSDGIYQQLKSLSPGQVSDAQQGAEMGQEFRRLYESGKVDPAITAKLMLWSFLSRGVSPYVQESAFVDLVDKIDPFIPSVLNGTFSDDDAKAWNKIVSATIKKGTGQPGAGSTHNANAFGASFMRGMAAPAANGQTKMQYLHSLFSDPSKTGPEIRREFVKMGEGVGIDNKVISFTLLVIGHDDVAVLDRVQIANTFNDGRLGNYNLYDGIARYGYEADGKLVWVGSTPADYASAKELAPDGEVISAKVPGSGMANLTTGARGLMIYEPLEGALEKVLPDIFGRLRSDGLRSADTRPSVGRWHWESWVAYSGQEASHKTLEALLAEAKGQKSPYADVSAKEGEYGAFSYGTEYARDAQGKAYKLYYDSTGQAYRFSLDSYKEMMVEVKKKGKDGVVPFGFKISENEDGSQRSEPWFRDPRVNLAKFDEAIHRIGKAEAAKAAPATMETEAIFAGLEKRGLAKTRAEATLANHPDSAQLKYVQENFHDILIELEDADKVEINCK